MGRFLAGIKKIHEVSPECCIVIIHHTGHTDKHRARGSSSLPGAIDASYRVDNQDGLLTLTNTKMRGSKPPPVVSMRMEDKPLPWLDDEREPIVCVVLEPTDEKPQPKARPMSATQKEVMDAVEIAIKEHGEIRVINEPEADTLKTGQKSVSKDEIRPGFLPDLHCRRRAQNKEPI